MDDNDTPQPATEPLRPARPRSAPPIIDAEAEKPRPAFDWRLLTVALLGGLIGGALVFGSMLVLPAKNPADARLAASEASLHSLEAQQNSLAAALDALKHTPQTPAAPVDLQPIMQRLVALEDALAARPATSSQPDLALVKAAARLARALAMRDHLASQGASAYTALHAEWVRLKAAPVTPAPEAASSLNDTLLKALSRFVTISDVKDTPKTDTKAADDAIAMALQARDGTRALTLWQSLPAADQSGSTAWAASLKQRVEAELAANRAVEDALAELDKTEAAP
jgi:hypothetical protein